MHFGPIDYPSLTIGAHAEAAAVLLVRAPGREVAQEVADGAHVGEEAGIDRGGGAGISLVVAHLRHICNLVRQLVEDSCRGFDRRSFR